MALLINSTKKMEENSSPKKKLLNISNNTSKNCK